MLKHRAGDFVTRVDFCCSVFEVLCVWLTLLLRSHVFFFFVCVFWSRWDGTGSQIYYSQVFQCEKWVMLPDFFFFFLLKFSSCVCGGWEKVGNGMSLWRDFMAVIGFVLLWLAMSADLFSPFVRNVKSGSSHNSASLSGCCVTKWFVLPSFVELPFDNSLKFLVSVLTFSIRFY